MNAVVFYTEVSSASLEAVCKELKAHSCECLPKKVSEKTTKTIQEQFFPFPEGVTHLVFIFPPGDSDFSHIGVFLFFAGYCFGNNIRAVAISPDAKFPVPFQFKSVATFIGVEALSSFLKAEAKRIAVEETALAARHKLLAMGISFFAESFFKCVEAGNEEACRLFLQAGFDANMKDMRENPLLTVAVRGGSAAIVEILLEGGSDINAPSGDRGYSPLMDAVYTKNASLASLLLERGADPNARGKDGQTAICIAAGRSDAETCSLLMKYNADPTIKDALGMSAAGYAKLFRNEVLCSLFGL